MIVVCWAVLIAHMADTHLGLRQYGLLWREEDLYRRFVEALELAVKEGVNAILISGDMFDRSKPPNQALRTVIQALSLPRSKGIPVYVVLGEHDLPKTRDIPPQFIVPGLKVLGTSTTPYYDVINVDGEEWWIAGISHRPPTRKGLQNLWDRIHEISRDVGRNSVLMMHQNLVNIFSLEPGIDINRLPKAFKYVAMGHIHKRWYTKEPIPLAYPGSLEIIKTDEIEEWRKNGKGFYLVDLSGDLPDINPVNIDVTPQIIVESRYPNHRRDVSLATQKIPEGRRAILHVRICIPAGVKAQPAAEVFDILRKVDREGRFYARISTVPCMPTSPGSLTGSLKSERLIKEEDVIAQLLSGGREADSESLRIAKIVVKLKNEASEGRHADSITPLIEELLSAELFWRERVRLPSLLDVESALAPVEEVEAHRLVGGRRRMPKPGPGGGGLEKFIR